MIQRIQTVWLLLIALAMTFLVFLPVAEDQKAEFCGIPYCLLFKIICGLTGALSLITLFLYKNRTLQFKLCFGILFLLIVSFITIFDWPVKVIDIIIPFLAIPLSMLLNILAMRAIRKDENLVRSLNRLR